MGIHASPWIGTVLGGDAIAECCTVKHGLRFYTPGVVNGEALTAYDRAEALGTAMTLEAVEAVQVGAFALTPSGEQALADLDVSAMQKTEREIKRINGEGKRVD